MSRFSSAEHFFYW